MPAEAPFNIEEATRKFSQIMESGGPTTLALLYEEINLVVRVHEGDRYNPQRYIDVDLQSMNVGQDFYEDTDQLISWFDEGTSQIYDIEPINEEQFRSLRVKLESHEEIRTPVRFQAQRIRAVGRRIWQDHLATPVEMQ